MKSLTTLYQNKAVFCNVCEQKNIIRTPLIAASPTSSDGIKCRIESQLDTHFAIHGTYL